MKKSIRKEQGLSSAPVFAMATVAALGATMAGAGVALAQQGEASLAGSDVAVSATEQAVSAQVKSAHVEGTFSFTQGQITPTAQIAHDLGGANKVLCGASTEALPSNQRVVSDAADWQVTVDGDGVQTSLTTTIGDLAQTGTQSTVMGCSCAGNPADGRATANAAVTGVSVYDLLEAAGGVSSGANAITFVSSDGYEVTLPLSYVLQRASMIVYQLNGEPLSASVGGTNQLWLGSTSARYFASDVVEVRVTCEDEAPAIPGSPASGDHASNVPNVGVTAGASA